MNNRTRNEECRRWDNISGLKLFTTFGKKATKSIIWFSFGYAKNLTWWTPDFICCWLHCSQISTLKQSLGGHIAGQLVRSSSSPALNYGEAQAAESRMILFIKWKFVSKDLRELSIVCLILKPELVPGSSVWVNWSPKQMSWFLFLFPVFKTAQKNKE